MEVLLLLIRIFLFAIFAIAGVGKLLDLKGAEKAVKDFGTPEEFAKTFAIALPFAEIVFAFCFLFVDFAWFGALGALLLLLTFIGGMIYQMAQGNAPDCHCFGAIHSEPVSKKSLLRNVIFAILALFLVAQGSENQGLNIWDLANDMALQLFLGLAVIALLGAAVYFLRKISEQQNQIMRRIEILELTATEGGKTVEREEVKDPNEGLPIGAPAPDFALPDLNGKTVAFEHLLAKRKPVLFFFVSPTCNPCAALLPEIERWQTELKGKLDFVFISSGKAKENAEKFGGDTFKQVLLQKDREVAEMFGAQWTPTAVLVNADGAIASAPAAGDAAIRALVEKIKNEPEIKFVANGNGGKIGEDFPEFVLPAANGDEFQASKIRGRRTLVTYWSVGCGFCTQMLEDLREWDKTRGADEPELLLLSSGEAEKNLELNLKSPIVLDDKLEISKKLGMTGTPSAVLVDENGKIVSEVAVGAPRIWALLGKKK
jgi:peroxiredoxin/uncharacterized membrane protein YphA (DoxX/SURF4 family)